MSKNNINLATKPDITSMVDLSYQKRKNYEKAQPQFWKYAKNAEEIQAKWFEELLEHQDYILLVAKDKNKIVSFVIGRLVNAPEVYNPEGLTLMIDDYSVETQENWTDIGKELLKKIAKISKEKGAAQFCIVAGAHDNNKCSFLEDFGLSWASR
jgi:hypothetical protein